MISREPTLERLATARALLLDPYGLDDAALATDTWKNKAQGDRMLAELYLRKMQFAFGPDEADWGKSGAELARAAGGRGTGDLNLYAAHLKGTQAAVLAPYPLGGQHLPARCPSPVSDQRPQRRADQRRSRPGPQGHRRRHPQGQ